MAMIADKQTQEQEDKQISSSALEFFKRQQELRQKRVLKRRQRRRLKENRIKSIYDLTWN